MSQSFTVDPGAAGERLDVFLAGALDLPRNRVKHLLDAGRVQVNTKPERPSYRVEVGDNVEATLPRTAPRTQYPAPELPVVYEDADLLVIDKPAGIATHPGAGTQEATVADFAREHTSDPDSERPGIVHRLDKDTSGLLILAKTLPAKEHLQQQFRARRVHKTYTLLVVGRPEPAEAVIKLPVARDPAHPLKRTVISGGRDAITKYRTLAAYPGFTLLEAEPETGRTHQLRVHFAALGHPIAGDALYGPTKSQTRRGQKAPLGLARQFLHASNLEFVAPSGRSVKAESALPADLEEALVRLGEKH